MTTNPFFNKYFAENEQMLYDDLVVEYIQINGMDIYYIPRNIINFNKIYETDDQSTYSTTIPVEVYLESIDGFQGDQNIFTKFQLEIRDQVTVSMARRTFERIIQPVTKQPRPMEGDLIYFPMNKKVFQIKFTNNKEIFYPLGILPTYKLTCELFEYSGESFDTGIPEIDILQSLFSLNVFDNVYITESGLMITDENGNRLTNEYYDEENIDPIVDDDILKIDADTFVDWSESNPFGEVEQ